MKLKLLLLLFFNLCIASIALHAQTTVTVKGILKDQTGTPLSGVTVTESSKNGTVTNDKGEFTIVVHDANATLDFSYVGYLSQKIPLAGQTELSVVLKTDDAKAKLAEVVVVGYGTQRRATVTGSISQVKGSDLVKSPAANITNTLAGRLPGLQVVQSSGEPGHDAASINIRGFGDALIIVDGVATPFSQLDPNEIESISILKDGAAAVYGFNSANGVVLVTTKRGTNNKPKIAYSNYFGFQKVTRFPAMLNAAQFVELQDEALVNTGQAPQYGAEELAKWRAGTAPGYQSTDWAGLAIKNSTPQQYHNVSVSGGNETTKYFLSIGYLNQSGLWASGDTRFKRYNIRSNVTTKIAKNVTIDFNVGARMENRNYPQSDPRSLMGNIQRAYPIYTAYANNNPQYYNLPNINGNALAAANNSVSGYDNEKVRFFSASATLTYDIPRVKGLNVKAQYSYQSRNEYDKNFNKSFALYKYNSATETYNNAFTSLNNSLLNISSDQDDKSVLNLSVNYATSIADKHNFKLLLLTERMEDINPYFSAHRQFDLDGIEQLSAGSSTNVNNAGSEKQAANVGYVFRANYDYKNKYMIEYAGRYDGSYKFPPDGRWGLFHSVSAGWRISSESFFKSDVVSNLKLRGSWGKLGDDGSATGGQFYDAYNYPSGNYLFGSGIITAGLALGTVPNYKLTWMTSYTTNLAVEAGFLKNMFTLEFEVFNRHRIGIPATRNGSVPSTVGAPLPEENINDDYTRGFDLSVGFNKKIGAVMLNVSPNISLSRTKWGHHEEAAPTNAFDNWYNSSSNRWQNISWGYKSIGQFQTAEEIATSPIQDANNNHSLSPGDIKYADLNKDGKIDDKDQAILGWGTKPQMYYGMNISATYKGFDFSALFQGASQFNIFLSGLMQNPFFNNSNAFSFFTDRWRHKDIYDAKSPWIPGKFPATVISGKTNNTYGSDFWMTDASYLRLRTIELGYSLNKSLLTKTGLGSVRAYVSVQNLLTLSKIKYLDPEAPTSTATNGNGLYYPQQKVFTVGLNVSF